MGRDYLIPVISEGVTMLNRFAKGSGCYKCLGCGKLTRAVGDEAGTVFNGEGFCAACYEQGLIENEHYDDYHIEEKRKDCPLCYPK
jgi:hypothetical protein